MNVRIPTLLLVIATALLVAGCGDDTSASSKSSDDSATTTATTATTATTTTDDAAATDAAATEGTVLELKNDGDKMAYDTTELSAPAGEITIKLTNDSAIPHDIVVDGYEDDASELIADGKSTETTVTLEPGTYEYYCTPHRAAGMVGTLTVT
jgi:plastocyanin